MVPNVTVLILNFNGRDDLVTCLESLAELTYPQERTEILVVDNGSTDGSADYVASHFPDVRLIRLPENVGFAKGNNVGVEAATGEYIALLNNDMRVDPEWLSALVDVIETDPDVAAVGSKILTWDGDDIDFVGGTVNFYGMGFQPQDKEALADGTIREVLFACGGAMLIKRDVFIDVGGFDEDYFAYFEDVDLGWRLWVLGHRVLLAPRSVTYHRGHTTGKKFATERRALLYERNALYTILKNYEEETLNRVLPVALLLTARRAVMMSWADKRDFRMEAQMPASAIWPASKGPARLAEKSLRQELGTMLKEFGFWAVFKETVRRGLRWIYARTILLIRRDIAVVPRESLSPLMALDDIAEQLPEIWARRQEIQRRRERSDAEILPLFIEPFHPHPPHPAYVAIQDRLTHLFQMEALFSEGDGEQEAV